MFKGKPWKDVRENLGGMPWPFSGQASQFDKKGPPGLSYFKGESGGSLKEGQWVDCLLWRDKKGILKGIVYHYPQNMALEKKGNMNVFISPDSKRQGIASKLVAEAIKRYDVDLRQQRYSEEGAAFINNFVRNLPENTNGVSGRMSSDLSPERRIEIDEYIKNNPDKTNKFIAKKFKAAEKTIATRRKLWGLSTSRTLRAQRADKPEEETPTDSSKMTGSRFPERDAQIIDKYKDGMSLSEIAKFAGTTPSAVTWVLNQARKRGLIGEPRSGVKNPADIPRNAKIVQLYESGKSYAEIAKQLKLTTNVVRNAVLKSGKMKPVKRRRVSER